MKTLIFNNLSISTFFIIVFFRMLNFQIFFISIEKYFRNKSFIKILFFFKIKWFNYGEYKINHVINEQYLKANLFGEDLSKEISDKIWNNSLEEFYENKLFFNACLSKKIFRESLSLIEIMTIAKYFEQNNHRVFLWMSNNLISKKINKKFYQLKNLNIFPNLNILKNIFVLFLLYIKKIISFFSIYFRKEKFKKRQEVENKLDNFKIAFFPHKTIFYSNLYIKDYYYSKNEKDPFFHKNILHVEWERNDISKEAKSFYEEKKIQYIFWKDIGKDLRTFKKIIF